MTDKLEFQNIYARLHELRLQWREHSEKYKRKADAIWRTMNDAEHHTRQYLIRDAGKYEGMSEAYDDMQRDIFLMFGDLRAWAVEHYGYNK